MTVPPAGRVFLVRHGRVHNPRRVAYGFLPRMGLDAEGRAQATRAGAYLRDYAPIALFTSPLLRAEQTARLVRASLPPLPVHRSWLLRESELARVWQGAPISERPALFPEEYRLFTETPSLSTAGETMADQAARMLRMLHRALRRYPGGPIIALRLATEGRSFDELHKTRAETGSITEFRFRSGFAEVVNYVEP